MCRAYPSGGIPGCGTTSAAPPAAGTPCNANRQQHFQQAAVAAYSILSNRWSEWALGPKSYDGYPLQRAIQASQQLYLDISAAATTRAPRRTGSRWRRSRPYGRGSDAFTINAYLRDPKFNLGGNPVEWEYTPARLVYDLKLIYEAANRVGAALGLTPLVKPTDAIWNRY